MKKDNVRFVDNILLGDRKDYVEMIADAVFSIDDEGDALYRPYLFEEAFELGFYIYAVAGIEFEMVEHDGVQELENILDVCRADKEVTTLFKEYNDNKFSDRAIVDVLWDIAGEARELIEFRKDEYLAHRRDTVGEIADGLYQIGRLIEAIDFEKLDSNIIVQSLVTSFAKTPIFEQYLQTVGDWAQKVEEANAATNDKETDITEVSKDGERDS